MHLVDRQLYQKWDKQTDRQIDRYRPHVEYIYIFTMLGTFYINIKLLDISKATASRCRAFVALTIYRPLLRPENTFNNVPERLIHQNIYTQTHERPCTLYISARQFMHTASRT